VPPLPNAAAGIPNRTTVDPAFLDLTTRECISLAVSVRSPG
jgi:hypothetical protein